MLKLYCRTYQRILKILMHLLPWRIPKTLEGAGCIKNLPALIKEQGFSKVLIVTGSVLTKLGVLDQMLAAMEKIGVEYVLFSGVQPNPTDMNAYDGAELYTENNCQALVAFGGGSPMDCCKAICALTARRGKTIEQLQGLFKVIRKTPTIFAVPTTSGTGSEATAAAVITCESTRHKASITDLRLMPEFAILDPCLTLSLSPAATASTGMDALCHAVEAYTNNTYNSRLEKTLAEEAVKLIYDNLYTAYCDGNNLTARQNMQKAAFYAGRAFTRGSVGYVHAIGHTLGGLYDVPHGLAMAVILPHVLRQFGSAVHERLARLAEICGMDGADDGAKAENFIHWIEELKEKMTIPKGLDVIQSEDIPQIISWAMKESNPLYPVPVIWTKRDFEEIISVIRTAQ